MRELDLDRIREMFWLFGMVLPINGIQEKEAIKATLGHGIEEFLPDLMILLAGYCQRQPELFDSYLTFIEEAIKYMRKESNKHPKTEYDFEQYRKKMLVNLGRQKELKEIKPSEIDYPEKK